MKIGFAFCGSFCNHPGLLKIYEDIAREHEIVPILSENAAKYSTRFGTAEDFVCLLYTSPSPRDRGHRGAPCRAKYRGGGASRPTGGDGGARHRALHGQYAC